MKRALERMWLSIAKSYVRSFVDYLPMDNISVLNSDLLEKVITEDEDWEAITSMGNDRAHGPDGFLWGFIEIVGSL